MTRMNSYAYFGSFYLDKNENEVSLEVFQACSMLNCKVNFHILDEREVLATILTF